MTLPELMIAMLIGTVLIAGAITVFVQSRANFRTADSVARLQESARYALDIMEPDIRLAGNWGRSGTVPEVPGNPGATCGLIDATDMVYNQLGRSIVLIDEDDPAAGPDVQPCELEDRRTGTDVLIVRHASSRIMPAEDGQAQVAGHEIRNIVFTDGVPPATLGAPGEFDVRDLVTNVYYVSNDSLIGSTIDDASGLPALRRRSLVRGPGGPRFEDQQIMPGVEDFQVQLGIDSNLADWQTSADQWIDSQAAMPPDSRIVAVRLWLLVRSETDERGIGYVDDRTYTRPDDEVIDPTDNAADNPFFPETFRRVPATKTITLRNARGYEPS